jgi:prolyl-tRNA synthetase
MGCYGIGIGRTLAAVVEAHHDDKGIVWPQSIAPYRVYLIRLGEEAAVATAADAVYKDLTAAGIAVLYDDRTDVRAGEKFADADLLGMPYRLVVSSKTLAGNQIEVKKRTETETQLTDQNAVIKMVSPTQN